MQVSTSRSGLSPLQRAVAFIPVPLNEPPYDDSRHFDYHCQQGKNVGDKPLTAQIGSPPVDSNPLAHTPAMSNGEQIAQDASFIPVDWH